MFSKAIRKMKKVRRDNDLRKFLLSSAVVLVGVLGIQMALSASYLFAFHDPQPVKVPIAVIGSTDEVAAAVTSIERVADSAFTVSRVDSLDQAKQQLRQHKIFGAYTPSVPRGSIMVASASDQKLSAVAAQFLQSVDTPYQQQARQTLAQQSQTLELSRAPVELAVVTDIVPLHANDPNGLGLFYVAFSFVFGGYLAAVALNVRRGDRRFTHRNALARSAAFGVFAIVGSVLIAWLAIGGVGVFELSAFWPIVLIGTLTTLGVGLFSSALISLLGTIGTGLIILLFVVIGTPASGGPLPLALAGSGPWQWLSAALPTGQSLEMLRSAIYFDGFQFWQHAWVLVVYVVVGFTILVIFGLRKSTISGALSGGDTDA